MFELTEVKHDVTIVRKACLCCKQESQIAVHRSTCLRCIKYFTKQGGPYSIDPNHLTDDQIMCISSEQVGPIEKEKAIRYVRFGGAWVVASNVIKLKHDETNRDDFGSAWHFIRMERLRMGKWIIVSNHSNQIHSILSTDRRGWNV